MNKKTILALYDDRTDARRAVEQLHHAGVGRDDISLISNNALEEERIPEHRETHHRDSSEATKTGAGTGGVIGGIAGLLLGLGAFAIPGIGPVVAAGPIVGLLAGAGIGAAAGGLIGALVDMGVPEHEASIYSEAVRRGGTLVAATVPEDRVRAVSDALNRFHPVDIEERSKTWRQEGWKGFDARETQPMPRERITAERERLAQEKKIPVVEEELAVGKREVDRGTVRVRSYTVTEPVREEVTLREEHVDVKRRPADRELTGAERDRAFQDQTLELTERAEEPVVGKKARVAEEVVVNKRSSERPETITDKVRHTEVEVDRGGDDRAEGWKRHFKSSIRRDNERFEDFEPAYRFGHSRASSDAFANQSWDAARHNLQSAWGREHGASTWKRYEPAVRHGYSSSRS